ncbi:hypothetical protein FA13DRAFT_71825 [Coprinellus micaceus]|uniref:Uncharacterized protein n=1 Tax=Coprinellus micaceus TaxID=71717 RepID=A0A4Y7TJ44_COPMI|nr:hypothetical protein FA13DRAFT_71825 [Coprinellus micaceus]
MSRWIVQRTEALKPFNLIPPTADVHPITFNPTSAVPSAISSFPPPSMASPPFPTSIITGAPASEPLNVSSSELNRNTSPSNVNDPASLSPASLNPSDSLMTGISSPAPMAASSPQNHTTLNGTSITKGKGKASAEDENRVDWRAAVESSRECSVSDVDTAAVQAAMSMSKKVHEAVQRQQVSSVYHSQSGEAYELLASGSSSVADDSDEALDAELAALLHESEFELVEEGPSPLKEPIVRGEESQEEEASPYPGTGRRGRPRTRRRVEGRPCWFPRLR